MSNSKYNYIWKFLKENDCGEADNITDDVMCSICKKVLVDTCTAICGCRYCHGCATDYLKEGPKFCPGNTIECKEELLDLEKFSYPDHTVNLKISKLIVKCPSEFCEFKGELRVMEEHGRVCKSQAVNCPYSNIGCQETRIVGDGMNNHLIDQNELHARLLMECVGMLQNENGSMKSDITKLTNQIGEMKIKMEDQQKVVEQEIQAVKKDNKMITQEYNSLKLDLERIRVQYTVLTVSTEKQISEIRLLGQTHAQGMEQLRELYSRSEAKLARIEWQVLKEKELRRSIGEVRQTQTKCDDIPMPFPKIGISTEKRESREFLWRIHDWSVWKESTRHGKGMQLFSDDFYSHENGYKMCLSVWADSIYFSVWWHLMKGEFDDNLSWPFHGHVTLSIVNQDTNLDHVCYIVTSDVRPGDYKWKKPKTERSDGFGKYNLMKLEEFARKPALCKTDRIFIKCVMSVVP